MKNAREWKTYYAEERARLGEARLNALVEAAPHVELPPRGALVFPHTRLEVSGGLVAAAARAAVRSGADTVLAIGVLHGARAADAGEVARARAGDPSARSALRRVHGPGAPRDDARWTEEFSLDGFEALLPFAARVERRTAPRLVRRFPFLSGETPDDLPGLDELRRLLADGAALVATADVIHHGVGYGTPEDEALARDDPETINVARGTVEEGLGLLARCDFAAFLAHAAAVKSDFRDGGPVVAGLVGSGALAHRVHELALVDYTEALGAPPPTWVAAVLAGLTASPSVIRDQPRRGPSA